MSSIKHPVGPQPPSVYWRRRLLLALGLLAVIVVIVLIVVRPGAGSGGEADPTDDPAGTASDAPTDTATDGPEAGGPCDPSVVQLEAVTDADSYPAGQQPQISMRITNTGSVECTIDADPSLQEYVVTSGSDRIWSSKDCSPGESTPTEVLLLPGTPQDTAPGTWPLVRSAEGCPADQPAAVGGGATYRLTVSLGEITSEPKVFLLN